jgi:hypothetical protein
MRLVSILAFGIAIVTGAVVIESAAVRVRQSVDIEPNRRLPLDVQQAKGLRLQVITKQLPPENGVNPVELKCVDAELSSPNALEKLSCVLINKTSKPISAGAIYTSMNVEKEGVLSVSSDYVMFDTFIHPDFRNEHRNNLFLPGQEYPQDKLPVTYDFGIVIKSVIVGIDYIEFADKTSLGPNQAGSRIISDSRLGAAKYKNWLVQRYDQAGKSLAAVIPLLDGNEELPEELGFQTGSELGGARMYRNFARRTYKTEGAEGLLKYLKNPRSSLYKPE